MYFSADLLSNREILSIVMLSIEVAEFSWLVIGKHEIVHSYRFNLTYKDVVVTLLQKRMISTTSSNITGCATGILYIHLHVYIC